MLWLNMYLDHHQEATLICAEI